MIGGRRPSLGIFDLDNTLADREWFFNEWARGSNNRCISGTKRDERRASPPAFVTSRSLRAHTSAAQCRMALRGGHVVPRQNVV